MYKIKRQRRPSFMDSREFKAAVEDFHKFHHDGGSRGKQGRSPLLALLKPFRDEIAAALEKQFDGLCAYTEVPATDDAPLHHVWHRPEANATELDGTVSPDHYWWQAMDWSNWYHASAEVRSTKSFLFPVEGERTSAPKTDTAKLRIPRALDNGLLIDPCRDDPAWWFRFQINGKVTRREPLPFSADRGEVSIHRYGLASEHLVASRRTAIASGRKLYPATSHPADFRELVSETTDNSKPHRGAVVQALVRERLKESRPPLSATEIEWLGEHHPVVFVTQLADAGIVRNKFPRDRRSALDDALSRSAADLPEIVESQWFQQLSGAASAPVSSPSSSSSDSREPSSDTEVITTSDLITKVTIRNFRAIEHVEIELAIEEVDLAGLIDLDQVAEQPLTELLGRGWKMLLGENGSGKSTVLHAIALALSGGDIDAAMERAQLTWAKILRWPDPDDGSRPDGQVVIEFSSGQSIDMNFNLDGHWFKGPGGKAPTIHTNIRGYGAARFPRRGSDPVASPSLPETGPATSIDVGNLLDSGVPIMDAEDWLATLNVPEFEVAALTLGDLLGESSFADERSEPIGPMTVGRITRNDDNEIAVDGEPLSQVSDGYRSVVALGCEIMAGIGGLGHGQGGTSDFRFSPGIVMIDEIGAHLHPRWRMQITGRMRRAFPNVQFFVTTHEPLCLRGLGEREVIRVLKYRDHGVVLDQVDRAPGRYRVDQLLTSEFFGMDSAIDPLVDRKFREYHELKRRPKRELSSTEIEKLKALEAELNGEALRPVLGYTRRDQLIFEAIDDFLLQDANGVIAPQERQEERKKIVKKVADIWRDIASSP